MIAEVNGELPTEYGHKLLENFRDMTLGFTNKLSRSSTKRYFTGYGSVSSAINNPDQKQSEKFELFISIPLPFTPPRLVIKLQTKYSPT
jgi:hypothetical protein